MMTYWRAVLAPFGITAEQGSPMLANGATITLDAPVPLNAVIDGGRELIGSVNLISRDAGRDPALLLAAGTVNARKSIVDRLAGDDACPTFELGEVVGMAGVVTAGRLSSVTVLFEPDGVSYAAWPGVNRFALSRARVQADDLVAWP